VATADSDFDIVLAALEQRKDLDDIEKLQEILAQERGNG